MKEFSFTFMNIVRCLFPIIAAITGLILLVVGIGSTTDYRYYKDFKLSEKLFFVPLHSLLVTIPMITMGLSMFYIAYLLVSLIFGLNLPYTNLEWLKLMS